MASQLSLNRWVTLEELTKCLDRNCWVKTDIEHFVSVTYEPREFFCRIHIKYDETAPYSGDDARALYISRFHESLNHLSGKLP